MAAERLLTAAQARTFALLSRELTALMPTVAAVGPYTHVLVGDCRETLDYPALDEAFRAVRAGAELVALQRGRYFKRADGDHVDTGAVAGPPGWEPCRCAPASTPTSAPRGSPATPTTRSTRWRICPRCCAG
ncbi:hypothetical protein [Micromonospora gifhornensis]|uniref:hypothetical protein n=1 Tax=Micromonospora gifhornensis TaxID=84594 RepID=UPI001EF378B2|nr:hypothetical protein [Micromonospora gifhornensis]